MATIKSNTDLSQSKVLAEILPLESADMRIGNYVGKSGKVDGTNIHYYPKGESFGAPEIIYAWSLAALLGMIKDKCDYFELVYLKRTYCGKENPLENVYRLSTDVYDVYKKEALDACVAMIEKLHELKIL